MQTFIYYATLNSMAEDNLIKNLKNRDREKKHIIITPDKKSLFYEKRLFSLLEEEAFFDVTTTTLSRFANKVNNKTERILTKQGGVLIIKKILNEYASNLKSFGKDCNAVGFASVLFDTICMFKSCNVPYSDITECGNKLLAGKLNDIKFVYEKYEEYLKKEYTDSFNRLSLCAHNIAREDFKDTCVYFVGFDDFTKQAYAIIEKLMLSCDSVSIATTLGKKSDTKHNANIYLNVIYYNIIDLAKKHGIQINFVDSETTLSKEKEHILNEMFGYNLAKFSGDNRFVRLVSYNSIDDEIKNTVQEIKFRIINEKRKFNEFAIAVSNLQQYKDRLIKTFEEYGVNYFLDEAIKLKETIVARYLVDFISLAIRPNKYNLLGLLKSPLTGVDRSAVDNFEDYIVAFDVSGHALFKISDENSLSEILSRCADFVTKSSEQMTINERVDLIRNYIFDSEFEAKLEELKEQYYKKGDTYNYRALQQAYEKIVKIFDEFNSIEEYVCSAQEFLQFVNLYLDNVSITIPPVVTDAVFVTDISAGVMDETKTIYMLGANEGSVPAYVVDCGLISDKEIDDMPKSFRLSPSVAVINKRMKYRVFETLFLAKDELVVSYPSKTDGSDAYASSVVENLKNLFGLSVVSGSNLLDQIANNQFGFNEKNFVYNNFNQKTATKNFVENLKYWDNYNESESYVRILETLNEIVDGEYLKNVTFNNDIPDIKVRFDSDKIGISEIEKFNSCPYLHFCDYILKLKENDSSEINSMIIGNILHEFLKDAVFYTDKSVDWACTQLDKILNKPEYDKFAKNKKNNYVILALKDEVKRIFDVLQKQAGLSSFKPNKTELKFVSDKPVFVSGDKKLFLTGIIDRIDYCKNGFRILDYKTGKVDFKNYNGIYYGNKMQVVVYLSLFSDKNPDLMPLGALYLPISNEFSATSYEELYKMQGIVEKSLENLLNFDKNVSEEGYSSKILDIVTTSAGIKNNTYYKNMCLDEVQIKELAKFVLDKVSETIAKIISGVIKPVPIHEAEQCRYCKYLGLCNFNKLYGNVERGDKGYPNVESLKGGAENE